MNGFRVGFHVVLAYFFRREKNAHIHNVSAHLGGETSDIFYFQPETLQKMIEFDLRIFFQMFFF